MHRSCSQIVLTIVIFFGIATIAEAQGQFVQQGPKLQGAGRIGNAYRGNSVALSGNGNTALVGAPGDDDGKGAVWVFTRSNGVWGAAGTKLTLPGAYRGTGFGASVAYSTDGTTALIGVSTNIPYGGGAWIYTRTAGVWTQGAHLVTNTGYFVALSADGNTALVEDHSDDYSSLPLSGVTVFVRTNGLWSQQGSKLVGTDRQTISGSMSLSADGNTALIDGNTGAWVFTRTGGIWTQQGPKIVPSINRVLYGSVSVSLSGDGTTAILGAYGDENATGACFIYTRSNGIWTQQGPKLVGLGTGNNYQGTSVSLTRDGNYAIFNGGSDADLKLAAAWIFHREGTVWTQVGERLVGNDETGTWDWDWGGVAFSSDGSTAIMGSISDNNYFGSAWVFVKSTFALTSPVAQQVVLANASSAIKWSAGGVDSIRIDYSLDSGRTYHEITPGVATTLGGFTWQVPDTLSTKCMIAIADLKNPTDTVFSHVFKIKGYVLTRFDANGDYEKFDREIHAWWFANEGWLMWSEPWQMQFNYFGIDPMTKRPYPSSFRALPILAIPSNFIDWPLFVKTFTPGACYQNISGAVYSPIALWVWASHKDSSFKGSCFGFSQSSLLSFDRPKQFLQAFPEVGAFHNIHDLSPVNTLLPVINQLYEGQFGYQHKLYSHWKFTTTDTRSILAELKTYFLSDTVDHRSLAIFGDGGGHSIVPMSLVKFPNAEGQYILWVYDNNAPSGMAGNGKPTAVVLDSIYNKWQYDPLGWKDYRNGIYLEDPASTYLSTPLLIDPALSPSSALSPASVKDVGTVSYMSIYNTASSAIVITNAAGQGIGFCDSVSYSTIVDAMPIVPQNSRYQPPIGYFVPEASYAVQMNAFTDTSVAFSVLNGTGVFHYWRSGAVKNQTDRLSYEGGLMMGNRDAQTKTINLETITRLTGSERQVQVLNCAIVQNDSVKLTAPDSNRVVFINLGPAKSYDLNVVLAGAASSGQSTHARITVPAHSTHYIVPDWQELKHQSVKIYQDVGNTGKISDSLLATNQATGVNDRSIDKAPGEYILGQNYPNPFNPMTTIQYSLPQSSHVRLVVYDMLGQTVALLVDEEQTAGTHSAVVDMSAHSSGVYFYRLQAGAFTETKKFMLIR